MAGLEQFQQVGEGYLETLARVASNYAGLDAIMASTSENGGTASDREFVAFLRRLAG